MTYPTLSQALSALALAASAISTPAAAASMEDPPNITVSYRDLDISHPAGAAVLLHRLEAAATKACGGRPDVRVLEEVTTFDKCRSAALNRAVAQINAPMLTAAANYTERAVRIVRR